MAQAKNAEEFIAMQKQGIAANDECGTNHYNLAVALMGQKKYDEAEEEFLEAIRCSPNLAESYVQLGGICLQRGDLEGCLKYNQIATKYRAGFSIAYGNIGFVYLQKGEPEKAIKPLQKAIVYNTQFIQAYSTLANAYLMTGLIDESIETNKKAIDIDPNFPVVYNNLALCYMEQQDYQNAIECCDKAISLGYKVSDKILKELESHRL